MEGCLSSNTLSLNAGPRPRLGAAQNFSQWERLQRWSDGSNHAAVGNHSGVGLLCSCFSSYTFGCIWVWSSAETPNLEVSEVDDLDGEAVPCSEEEDPPEAPPPPTTGSCNVGHGDPERMVSGGNSRVDKLTGNKSALLAAILGNVVSVTFFDVFVLFTEITDHEHRRAKKMEKSRDGSVQWHWRMATTRGITS